jgi:hypothetical protein
VVDERWRRLSARESGEAVGEALFEGVPVHLDRLFRDWLVECTEAPMRRRVGAMTRTVGMPSDYGGFAVWMADRCPRDSLLDLIDAVLYVGPEPNRPRTPDMAISELDGLLLDGGSVYCVAADGRSLERRVAAEAAEAATRAMAMARSAAPSATNHLGAAWKAAYGLHPNPALAYSEAVKAVEAALIPVVQPNHGRATLGTVLGELRANSARWRIAIEHGSDHAGDVQPLVAMAETLWTGQTDRHAASGPTRSVSRDAAEAAVFLVATLVQWAQAGTLRRV